MQVFISLSIQCIKHLQFHRAHSLESHLLECGSSSQQLSIHTLTYIQAKVGNVRQTLKGKECECDMNVCVTVLLWLALENALSIKCSCQMPTVQFGLNIKFMLNS